MEIQEINDHIKSLNERLSALDEPKINEDFKPSYKHKILCKKVSRIAKKYHKHMSFLWEWEGEIVPIEKIEHDVTMCIQTQELIKRSTIFVAQTALDLDDYNLELTVVHEICHIFLRDLYITHINELHRVDVSEEYDWSAWGNNEEIACWRFAKTLLSVAGIEPAPLEKL